MKMSIELDKDELRTLCDEQEAEIKCFAQEMIKLKDKIKDLESIIRLQDEEKRTLRKRLLSWIDGYGGE